MLRKAKRDLFQQPVRAVIVSAMVLATALGPGVSGILIDQGIDLPAQLLVMAIWCVVGSLLLALASGKIIRRHAITG